MTPWKRKEVIGDCTLYLGDCLEILPTFGQVDAVVTDPPYGIALQPGRSERAHATPYNARRASHTQFSPIAGDTSDFDPAPFIAGKAILWGANNYAARLPASNGWLCWYKAGGISGFAMSECEMAWTNVLRSTRHFDHLWHGFKRATQSGEPVLHPTEKPVALMVWCLGFLPDAEMVLDPFMGSGTTGVACLKRGRKFIGIEIDEGYFDIACKRIRDAYAQPDMFVEASRSEPEQLSILDGAA